MSWKTLERYFLEIIQERRKGVWPNIVQALFFVFSQIYRFIIACRNFLYDYRLLPIYYPPVPMVISVGNLTVGGSGKTPVTMLLLETLKSKGKIAVLSRGYKSPAEHFGEPVILCQEQGPQYPASYCGDEPYMLALNYPHISIYVGANRYASAKLAAKYGANLLILDDGMQHRRLHRDVNIVVLDGCSALGNHHLLPRGLLREPPSSLKRADLLVLNHIRDEQHFDEVLLSLRAYTQAPAIGVAPTFAGIFSTSGEKIESIHQMKVGIFCGIGGPQYFRQMVASCGAEVVAEEISSDHQIPEPTQLAGFADQCRLLGAKMLICTEKDRVKLRETFSCSLPIAWIKMKLDILVGKELWQQFTENHRL